VTPGGFQLGIEITQIAGVGGDGVGRQATLDAEIGDESFAGGFEREGSHGLMGIGLREPGATAAHRLRFSDVAGLSGVGMSIVESPPRQEAHDMEDVWKAPGRDRVRSTISETCGTRLMGARLCALARAAAALHAARAESRDVDEGVTIEERLDLLEGRR
jgi:hypothetical protein